MLLPADPSLATVAHAAKIIRHAWTHTPRAAIVLGTGLGRFADAMQVDVEIACPDLPEFPVPTALSHRGVIACGHLGDVPVLMFSGRCHLYEGFSVAQIVMQVQLAAQLGAANIILSNASGGLNPAYCPGDLMLIDSHINLMGRRCRQMQTVGSMTFVRRQPSIYSAELLGLASALACRTGLFAHRGVYVGVAGPNYETRAEYRFLRTIGGDAVGMSTVPEALAAARLGMRVLGLSIVTNVARPDLPDRVDAQQVVDTAVGREPQLQELIIRLVAGLI